MRNRSCAPLESLTNRLSSAALQGTLVRLAAVCRQWRDAAAAAVDLCASNGLITLSASTPAGLLDSSLVQGWAAGITFLRVELDGGLSRAPGFHEFVSQTCGSLEFQDLHTREPYGANHAHAKAAACSSAVTNLACQGSIPVLLPQQLCQVDILLNTSARGVDKHQGLGLLLVRLQAIPGLEKVTLYLRDSSGISLRAAELHGLRLPQLRQGVQLYVDTGVVTIPDLSGLALPRSWKLQLFVRAGECEQTPMFQTGRLLQTLQQAVQPQDHLELLHRFSPLCVQHQRALGSLRAASIALTVPAQALVSLLCVPSLELTIQSGRKAAVEWAALAGCTGRIVLQKWHWWLHRQDMRLCITGYSGVPSTSVSWQLCIKRLRVEGLPTQAGQCDGHWLLQNKAACDAGWV